MRINQLGARKSSFRAAFFDKNINEQVSPFEEKCSEYKTVKNNKLTRMRSRQAQNQFKNNGGEQYTFKNVNKFSFYIDNDKNNQLSKEELSDFMDMFEEDGLNAFKLGNDFYQFNDIKEFNHLIDTDDNNELSEEEAATFDELLKEEH